MLPCVVKAQFLSEEVLIARLKSSAIPEEVMSKRSVVLHAGSVTPKEIAVIHEGLVRAGIDAVAYFETDRVLAGGDAEKAYSKYLTRREVAGLVLIQKKPSGFACYITLYNSNSDFVDAGQTAWSTTASTLSQLMNDIYRTALSSYQKKNLLINEVAETGLPVRVIEGNRSETYAYDLKIDNLAVPNFTDSMATQELAGIFKTYPLRYQLTDNTVSDRELRNKGFLYVLCVVHGRSAVVKELLGYTVNPSESAFVSVTYPETGMQLKNIPAETEVFKFYVRHIDSGNVFLSTKWDADTSWQQALQNFINGLKAEMKL
ncbi:MAG TPA: hypothetical protein VFM90_03175 [Cyclobacteriaceae bacterium]|nr:hypothetical protein [Cyclobacteriaceae bacterium]